jgi:uncharacterized protein YecE (DUF72 family)
MKQPRNSASRYNPSMPELRIGTSAFTAAGWPGSFYPSGMQPRDFLTYYATKFDSVEVDSTFYRTPSRSTVKGWEEKTPEGFLFSAKVPSVITHEKCLDGCEEELGHFLETMDLLGDKLGPLLFQFPYFNRKAFKTDDDFLVKLSAFVKALPKGYKFALEIRNKNWMNEKLADLLRKHKVALVLIDQLWMPLPENLKFDYITADFSYVRLLGDRKGIELKTKTWDKVIVNRSRELRSWVDVCQRIYKRGESVFVYVNNHFAGHGPATVAQFLKLWNA